MQRYSAIKSQLVRVIIIILPLSMLYSSVHGFTRKLLADYSSRDADNISHYVVLIQRNDDEWLRFEKPFPEACIDGTCAMELELEPEAEYLFIALFKNATGDGRQAQLVYKTGKVNLIENNSPVINATLTINSAGAWIQGTVTDESHVDVRIYGNTTIRNFGYSDFIFEVPLDESPSVVLEAEDIHGNITFTGVNLSSVSNFDKEYYLSVKLTALQTYGSSWAGTDIDDLEYYMWSVGLTAQSHYLEYGYLEGLGPNQYFSHSEYIRANATAMYYSGDYPSVDEAEAAFNAAWPYDAYQHYLMYGAAEGINPSNSFDESAYLADKLAALWAEGSGWDDKTIDDLRNLLALLGMTALDHYLNYGQFEGLSVTPVPADERVEE